jgi:hypothetical protein
MFAQGSPYYFFGTSWGGCALGRGRHTSEVCDMYDSIPEFREFIERKFVDGSLSRSNFITLVSSSHKGESGEDVAAALVREFDKQ